MFKNSRNPYSSPMCEVLEMSSPEVLCQSNVNFGGSTEDVGNLEDIFGSNN